MEDANKRSDGRRYETTGPPTCVPARNRASLPLMDTKRLEYFIAIVEAGSINRAAERLSISQPALSQHLAILERELNVQLLSRSRFGVGLTAAGKRVHERAQVLVRQVRDLHADAREQQRQAVGTVAIGLPATLGLSLGTALAAYLPSAHPGLQLQLHDGANIELVDALASGALDMAVLSLAGSSGGAKAELLYEDEFVLVTAAAAAPPPTDVAALAALPWMVTRAPYTLRAFVTEAFLRHGQRITVALEVDSLLIGLEMARAGLGVMLLPRAAFTPAPPLGLACWPVLGGTLRQSVYLHVRPDRAASAPVAAVRQAIKQVVLNKGYAASL